MERAENNLKSLENTYTLQLSSFVEEVGRILQPRKTGDTTCFGKEKMETDGDKIIELKKMYGEFEKNIQRTKEEIDGARERVAISRNMKRREMELIQRMMRL